MAAVRQDGRALQFVPRALQDRAMVEAALANTEMAAQFISNLGAATAIFLERPTLLRFEMRRLPDGGLRQLQHAIVENDGSTFQYLPLDARRNMGFMELALATFPWALQWLPLRMGVGPRLRQLAEQGQRQFRLDNMTPAQRANHHYVTNVMHNDGMQLRFADEDLRNDVDVARAAVANDQRALQYVGALARATWEFIEWWTQHVGMTGWGARDKLRRMKEELDAAQDAFNAQGTNFDLYEVTRIQEMEQAYQDVLKTHAWYQKYFPEWYYMEHPLIRGANPPAPAPPPQAPGPSSDSGAGPSGANAYGGADTGDVQEEEDEEEEDEDGDDGVVAYWDDPSAQEPTMDPF